MDNYERTMKLKMEYAMQMVHAFGTFRVPFDWFDITVVKKEGEVNKKIPNGIHGYGTVYEEKDLLKMFPDYKDRILKACHVDLKKTKQGYIFIAKELSNKN